MAEHRILHIIPSLAPGGAEQVLVGLTGALADDFQHTILTLFPAENELNPDPSTDLKCVGLNHKAEIILRLGRLRKYVKSARADLIHCWMYHANLLSILALDLKIPLVWSIHNALESAGGIKLSTDFVIRVSGRLTAKVPDRIVYCSQTARQQHGKIGYCAPKSVVIPNGVDGERFYPARSKRRLLRQELGVGEDIPLFGRIARFDPQKDHTTFFAAAAQLRRELPESRFLLCGDNIRSDNRALFSLAQKNRVSQHCYFLGPRRDMINIYNGIDVLVSSSASEASPVSLLEAMACGVPVASTDVGDCATMLGDAGIVTEPGQPAKLAAAMAALYGQRSAKTKGTSVRCRRRIIDNFSISKMAKQYAKVYHELLWGRKVPLPIQPITPRDSEKNIDLDRLRQPGVDGDGLKMKVILVADTPGWAYDNICHHIKKNLGEHFEIKIVYGVDYPDYKNFYVDVFMASDTDLVHFIGREYLFSMVRKIRLDKLKPGLDAVHASRYFADKIITASVYDHLFLSEAEIDLRQHLFAMLDAYSVCSQRLRGLYQKHYAIPPDAVIEDGVELQLFRPANLKRFRNPRPELVVGWTGNSYWHKDDKDDPKGFHTILKPAIRQLQAEGYPIKSDFADVMVSPRPRSEMPEYYRKLDVLVCASSIEGTPNPVLEAMACGVPVVTTDVGIIPQLLGPEQQKFVLSERSVAEMADKLRQLADNRSILGTLSRENLDYIKEWTWEHHAAKWIQLFKIASSRHDLRAIQHKQDILLRYYEASDGTRGADTREFLKKMAFRLHADTLFWRRRKYMLKKQLSRISAAFSAAVKYLKARNKT